MGPNITVSNLDTVCPICGSNFTQDNIEGQAIKICSNNHKFLLRDFHVISKKEKEGEKMKTTGLTLAILGGILLISFAFLHAHVQGGWILVPIGLIGSGFFTFVRGVSKENKNKKP
jgi:hypothetical protein